MAIVLTTVNPTRMPGKLLWLTTRVGWKEGGLSYPSWVIHYPLELIRRVYYYVHDHGRKIERMNWQVPGENRWSGPPCWMTPPQPKDRRCAGQGRENPKSEQGSRFAGQMDCAQTMAQWDSLQSANTKSMDVSAQISCHWTYGGLGWRTVCDQTRAWRGDGEERYIAAAWSEDGGSL